MLTLHSTSASFLATTQAALEKEEALNSLILSIALRLLDQPDAYSANPAYLATWQHGNTVTYAAVMTPPYGLLVSSMNEALDGPVKAVVESLIAGGWPVPSVNAPAAAAAHFARLWSQRTGQSYHSALRERLFELTAVTFPPTPPGVFRKAEMRDIPTLARWIEAFTAEAVPFDPPPNGERIATRRLDVFSVWDDNGPVSMMANNRNTTNLANIGFVYTPPELRGHGYATAMVAAGSQSLLDAGRERCVLFTDLSNPTSNSIYQKIGYRPIADFEFFRFEPSPSV